MTDQDLARAARRGDADAFTELVHRHRHAVFRLAYRFAGTIEGAHDLCQDCLLRAYEQIHRFDPGRPFLPWLYRVCTNVCLNWRAADGRRTPAAGFVSLEEIEVPTEEGDGVTDRIVRRRWILEGLAALEPKVRLAIVLRFVAGLSYREIAEATGAKLPTVAYRVASGLEKLRRLVDSEMEGLENDL